MLLCDIELMKGQLQSMMLGLFFVVVALAVVVVVAVFHLAEL